MNRSCGYETKARRAHTVEEHENAKKRDRIRQCFGLLNNEDGFGLWMRYPAHFLQHSHDKSAPSEPGFLFWPQHLLAHEIAKFRTQFLDIFTKTTHRIETSLCAKELRHVPPYPHVAKIFVPDALITQMEARHEIVPMGPLFAGYATLAQQRTLRIHGAIARLNAACGLPAWHEIEQSALCDSRRPLQLQLTVPSLHNERQAYQDVIQGFNQLATLSSHTADLEWELCFELNSRSHLNGAAWEVDLHAANDTALKNGISTLEHEKPLLRRIFGCLASHADVTHLVRAVSPALQPKEAQYWNTFVAQSQRPMSAGEAMYDQRFPERAKHILRARIPALHSLS